MGNFNRGRGNSFKSRSTEMFAAVCDECNKECEVPFKPTGNKPVLCRDCFDKKNGGGNRREGKPRDRFEKRRGFREAAPAGMDPKLEKELAQINEKLDRLLRAVQIRSQAEPKVMDFDFEE